MTDKGQLDFSTFERRWRRANRRATETPLQEGTTLTPTSPTAFSYQETLGFSVFGFADRFEPIEPHRAAQATPARISNTGVTIISPISIEGRSWCQVWLAKVATGSPEQADVPVAIKLYQESLFPTPEELDYILGLRPTAAVLAHRESWAFRSLYDLQGSVIPHSYGFFDFLLPCGETVCGHVMEFIDGKPLARDWAAMDEPKWRSVAAREKREKKMELFMTRVHSLHLRGVVHRDLRPVNVLVVPKRAGSYVILDLGNATLMYDEDKSPSGNGVPSDDAPGARECLDEIDECGAVIRWLQRRFEDAPWKTTFGTIYRINRWESTADVAEEEMQEEAGLL